MTDIQSPPAAHVAFVDASGRPTPEFFRFLVALIAYVRALEARIAALEP